VPDPESLDAYPAVELFVQRGREIHPDLGQSPDDAAAIASICRRLDGLPLAIELAAARLDILPPPVLLERLRHSLPVLVGGARDLPDRLRTLRDAIAWSHDLLSDDEQVVFRRLSVFNGGFTAEAAAAVAGMADELTVLDVLGSLTDKSLLRLRPVSVSGEPGEPRYGMLETIREFAREKLTESAEEDVGERHADFFLHLAESSNPGIYESGEPVLLDRLERDHDNLRAALGWYRDAGDREKFLRLAGALGFFWYYRGAPQ
jgi:predicted ATPase